MMQYEWMDRSLQRSSKLSREVLERTRSRNVVWPSAIEFKKGNRDIGQICSVVCSAEEETAYATLNDAFATVLEFMAQTTAQCQKYYNSVQAGECTEHEVNHICRYHFRQLAETSNQATSPKNERKTMEDIQIEVEPGKYAVTVGPCDLKNTHLVFINPGQAVDFTVNV
ncbi:A-kinase-interacting protein 1 isoform X2 [Protopterus annectens]|uniref:A-kinase-interacting protein 1 isoform X2 n=1 Tax=Protopterus annectens TaxID=7888 RepID=UPI001CFAFCB3|nr:A-kinase-interacting protein 1 isoform X2 [Protopterus annectens]